MVKKEMTAHVWTKSPEGRRCFIGGSDARIIMGSDEAALVRLDGGRKGVKPSQRTCLATSSCSLAQRPRSSIAPGMSATPADRSATCGAGSGIRQLRG